MSDGGGYRTVPALGRRRGRILLGILLLPVVVGVGSIVVLTRRDREERREYVEALAAAYDNDDLFVLSRDERRCVAEAEVDVLGMTTLQSYVSPAEIRDSPGWQPRDFGIEPTHAQGLQMVDAVRRCMADHGAAFAAGLDADGMPVDDPDAVGDCLAAGFDSPPVRDLYATNYLVGDDMELTEAQANTVYDWMFSCIDIRAAMVSLMAEDLDAETADCVVGRVSDDWLRGLMVDGLAAGDKATLDGLEEAIRPLILDCIADSDG